MNPIEMIITFVGWLVALAIGAAVAVGTSYVLAEFVKWVFAG